MDWRLLLTTFVTIFAAELGDKTQLATFSFAASASSRWMVFLGASLALVVTSAIAVIIGEGVGRIISPVLLRQGAGVLFIILGVLFLFTGAENGA